MASEKIAALEPGESRGEMLDSRSTCYGDARVAAGQG
jgi:hypothetical protein